LEFEAKQKKLQHQVVHHEKSCCVHAWWKAMWPLFGREAMYPESEREQFTEHAIRVLCEVLSYKEKFSACKFKPMTKDKPPRQRPTVDVDESNTY
jgi:hypothetical protein